VVNILPIDRLLGTVFAFVFYARRHLSCSHSALAAPCCPRLKLDSKQYLEFL
jgi:hypothetical protein